MSYGNLIVTSIFGRRLGLQPMSSAVSGSGRTGETPDFLQGPEALRLGVTTANSTSRNAAAYGVQFFPGTSAASSAVYTLDPPIPGVAVTLVVPSSANSPVYIKTANGETFLSSQGTTFSILKSTGTVVGSITLVGVTTAIWALPGGLSTATFALSTTT